MNVEIAGYNFTAYYPEFARSPVGGGVYIFAREDGYNKWTCLYVGETASFAERFANHERWDEASNFGATHILTYRTLRESDRMYVENRLIQELNPTMNDLLKIKK